MSYKDLYFEELEKNLKAYVCEDFTVSDIPSIDDIPDDCKACQHFLGGYSSLTGIYAPLDVLLEFACRYAKFDVELDIRDEVLGDFLNLHNGLVAVKLSNDMAVECSLTVPAMLPDDETKLLSNTYCKAYEFPFGKVAFFVSEP